MNTAVLTGRQVSQGMKVFIVSQAGTVADVTLQSSCHSEDESVLKVRGPCFGKKYRRVEAVGGGDDSSVLEYRKARAQRRVLCTQQDGAPVSLV